MLQHSLLRHVPCSEGITLKHKRRCENAQRDNIYDLEKQSLNEEDCSKLSRAFDLREESDYGIFRQISKDEAESVLKDAREFVEKVKKYYYKYF